ncbi:hypothetical protein U0070_021449 [Myodes glareolus]|uniref:Uncharacterized protein n=1 Tax=Myodes glareolus TaxID=447135 RepID=A0AAW0JCX5_MYOGA
MPSVSVVPSDSLTASASPYVKEQLIIFPAFTWEAKEISASTVPPENPCGIYQNHSWEVFSHWSGPCVSPFVIFCR